MTWTTYPPTAAGWYWFRYTPDYQPQCVQVFEDDPREPGVLRVWLVAVGHAVRIAKVSGLWAGPILPPA